MILSAAKSHGRQSGVDIQSLSEINAAIEFASNQTPAIILIDLQTPGFDYVEFANQVADMKTYSGRTIAFAQHVNTTTLEQATPLFDEIMTRGQFNKNLGTIISGVATNQ